MDQTSDAVDATRRDLMNRAAEMTRQAYAPYSRFHVGVAIMTEAGGIHVGCNVENVSYPVGTCAERNAIAAAIAAEGAGMRIRTLALAASQHGAPAACSPCGACRQAIVEFGENAEVLFRGPDDAWRAMTGRELLPAGFSFDLDRG